MGECINSVSSQKKEIISGVFYTSLAKYSNIAVQIVVTAILARLLSPADYGVVAIATIFIVFFNLLSDIGIGPAIIQFKDLNRNDLSNIFSFTAYVGLIISVVFFCCSWIIADYYENDSIVPVCQLLSLTIFFNCLNIVPLNIQYKKKRFKFLATVALLSQIVTAVIAIILALMSFGVYALVIQQIVSVTILFFIIYLQDKLPLHIRIDINPLKRIMSFSLFQFLFNIVNYYSRNLDKLLIGKFIGLESLGQYEKSYRLMMMPLQNLSFAVTPVMQPFFSNYQNDLHAMAEKYKRILELLSYIGFPLSILLFFTGRELILIFFGGQWEDAILPFRILALTVGLQILNGTAGSIYQSANATKQLFISGCCCAFFMVTSFCVSIWGWGTLFAVSIGFLIAQILNSVQVFCLLFRTLHYPLRIILKVMVHPLMVTCVIGLSLLLVYYFCVSMPLILSLIIKCIATLLLWYICVNYTGPNRGLVNIIAHKVIKRIHKGQ